MAETPCGTLDWGGSAAVLRPSQGFVLDISASACAGGFACVGFDVLGAISPQTIKIVSEELHEIIEFRLG
jgi:hypothetical protein